MRIDDQGDVDAGRPMPRPARVAVAVGVALVVGVGLLLALGRGPAILVDLAGLTRAVFCF